MTASKQTFKAIDIPPEKFLTVANPDTQIKSVDGILSYNTGIWGSRVDNAMPDFLIDLYVNGSSTHQNLVNLRSNLIIGNNLQAEDSTLQPLVLPFLQKRNKANDNLKSVYAKASKDMSLFNGCVLQVLFNREGKIAEVYHIPEQDFRLGIPNKFGQIEFGFISKTWGYIANSVEMRRKESVKIRMWTPDQWKKWPTQLIYIKDYSFNFYGIPAYNSAIPWILIDKNISDFHLNNVKSNFFLSMMLSIVKGAMSDKEIEDNAKEIEAFYSGVKGRKALIEYIDDIANASKIQQISGAEQDKLFDILSQQCFQKITTGHSAYPVLGGMDKSDNLGGDSNRLYTSLMSFTQLVCQPIKQIILDNFNMIMDYNGLPSLIAYTEPPKLTQVVQQPTDLTEAERRSILFGLAPKDDSSNAANNSNSIPS